MLSTAANSSAAASVRWVVTPGIQRDQGRGQVRSIDRHATTVRAAQRLPFYRLGGQGMTYLHPLKCAAEVVVVAQPHESWWRVRPD